MYSKKYRIEKIKEFGRHNFLYDEIDNNVCYLAYLNIGERGWFLYETNDLVLPAHRVHTSIIKNIDYIDDRVIVETQNTEFTFKLINK